MSLPDKSSDPAFMRFSDIDDDDEDPADIPDDNLVDATGKAIYKKPFTGMLIHDELLLSQGDNFPSANIHGRTKYNDGNIVGTFDFNPI